MPKKNNLPTAAITPLQQTIKDLQQQLAESEKGFDRFRGANSNLWEGEEWHVLSKACAGIRAQLFDLTGDYYGREKVKKVKPSDELLMADYETPWDVPKAVLTWLAANASLLTRRLSENSS